MLQKCTGASLNASSKIFLWCQLPPVPTADVEGIEWKNVMEIPVFMGVEGIHLLHIFRSSRALWHRSCRGTHEAPAPFRFLDGSAVISVYLLFRLLQ